MRDLLEDPGGRNRVSDIASRKPEMVSPGPSPAAFEDDAATTHYTARSGRPFSEFVRMVGRGPNVSRPLTLDEAREAMAMILDGKAEPAQLGAFLALMRYRKETPAELAGFVGAARDRMAATAAARPDIDWPSYADRHRQLPYFLLAAKLLSENGVRVLMHGISGEGRVTTPAVLTALGHPASADTATAARDLERTGFAYLPLDAVCPQMRLLFEMRPVLGLRSSANTFARMLNPFDAPAIVQGVFHPAYLATHRDTGILLGQRSLAVFKGGGGEVQRNPGKACHVLGLSDHRPIKEDWPALVPQSDYRWRDEPLHPQCVVALWTGQRTDAAPVASVTGTAAIALRLIGRAGSMDEAQKMADEMWRTRRRTAR